MVSFKTFEQLSVWVRLAVLTAVAATQIAIAWLVTPPVLHGQTGLLILGVALFVAVMVAMVRGSDRPSWSKELVSVLRTWSSSISAVGIVIGFSPQGPKMLALVFLPQLLYFLGQYAAFLATRYQLKRQNAA